MSTPTTQAAEFPSVDEIIEKMRVDGDWWLRKRKGVLPALWRHKTTANPKIVEVWIRERFPQVAWANSRDMKRLAEAVIAELRYHDHGLLTLSDETVGLI